MIQLEGIRDTVVPLVDGFLSAYPGVPVLWPNAPFDRDAPPERYVEVDIQVYGGEQVNLGLDPSTRVRGYVYVTSWSKEGIGTRAGAEHLSWFANALKYVSVAGLQFGAPQPDGNNSPPGWYCQHLKVGFHSTQH